MKCKTFLMVAAMVACLTAGPAQAVKFQFINTDESTAEGTQARSAFELGGRYWSSVLTNDVTVKIEIGFRPIDAIASAASTRASIGNAAFYNALGGSSSTSLDVIALSSLPTLSSRGALTVQTNALNTARNGYLDTATRIDNDGSANNRGLTVNTSLTRALGFTTNVRGETIDYGAADGSITFNSTRAYDFDPSDGIMSNAFDFLATVVHEIGHVLGFRSGVNTYDTLTSPGSSRTQAGALENAINIATPLDLFRYTAPGVLDWSTQGVPYFSIDGGFSELFGDSRFATGELNGDGDQASHWKDTPRGLPERTLMDPTTGRGLMGTVSALDVAAFDAIGWTPSFDPLRNSDYRVTTSDIFTTLSAVPEPGTWLMMLAGFATVGAALRHRPARRTRCASDV